MTDQPEHAILLVEDNENDVQLVLCALEAAEIHNRVHVVATGEDAIAYLAGEGIYQDRASYPLPRVVFLDLKLPRKSGHEVLEWMSRQDSLYAVIRVVLTASEEPEDLKKAYQFGANAYLRKPLTCEQLTTPGPNLRVALCGPNRPQGHSSSVK